LSLLLKARKSIVQGGILLDMKRLLPQGMADESGHNVGILIPHGGKIVSSWRKIILLNLIQKSLKLRRVLLGMTWSKG